jgi:hypothetical protein
VRELFHASELYQIRIAFTRKTLSLTNETPLWHDSPTMNAKQASAIYVIGFLALGAALAGAIAWANGGF